MTKYKELWDKIKNLIETMKDKPGKYGKEFMKIKFDFDDNLLLNKIVKLNSLIIVLRSIFQENDMDYSQRFLDECWYEI